MRPNRNGEPFGLGERLGQPNGERDAEALGVGHRYAIGHGRRERVGDSVPLDLALRFDVSERERDALTFALTDC